MVEILPIKDKDLLNELNGKYNCTASYGYICVERKEITAACLYKIENDSAFFCIVDTDEDPIFDGLVRACFANLIDIGIDKATFDKKINISILKKLRFVQDDTFFVKSLSEIIDKCKNCKNI